MISFQEVFLPSIFSLNYVYLYIYKYVPSFLQFGEIERKGVHLEEREGRVRVN